MLNGGGINPDGLSLDLQFAADKTLTARRGPTPVFTRGSGATQINAQGLIEWAPENLVASSENMSAFTRSEVVAPVSVSGGPTGSFSELAVTAINGFHFYRLFFNETTNTTAMMWVLAKRGTARYLRMGGGPASSFDWDTLTWSDTSPLHQTISPVAHPFGDGWYWLPIFRVSGSSLFDLTPSSTSGTTFSFNQSSVETVMVAAVQLSRSNLPQTGAINYYKTTGTSFYAPRFDHDPVTLACKGLLIEEGRTNLFSSTNLNDWATARVTKTAITGIGLTNQATTLTISETGSTYLVRGATLTTGVAYAISVRVKAGTGQSVGFGDLVDSKYSRSFNLSTNQWGASGGAPEFTNYTVTPNINGWFLVSAIYTPTGVTGGKNIAFFIYGTAVGQTASFDTPQIEAGSFPTSYIPTTTAPLARSADVCSITGGDFNSFYNQPEGTVIVHGDSASGNGSRWCGTSPARAFELYGRTSVTYFESSGGTENSIGAITLPTKFGLACKLNDFQGVRNGILGGTDTIATMPSPTTFNFGNLSAGNYLNGCIISLRYYKKRLPNAKIQALTV